MESESVCDIIRRAEDNYLHGTTTLGEYVNFSMHDTIEKIDAYYNSRHISGETDSLGRPKPFFNIVNAAVNIWYRATDIDRKDIRFIPTSAASIPLAFIANVMLQNWMNENRFGQFLNSWGRELAKYGSAVSKFVEVDGKLVASLVPWNRYIADPVQFDALPRIEKFYKTPAQLRNMATPGHRDYAGYDTDLVEQLLESRATRKTLDGAQKDIMNEFVELYEVHGELPLSIYKTAKGEEPAEGDETKFKQQMHVVSYVQKGKEYDDFTLFCGYEREDPYQKDDLIAEDSRTLGIGAVESLFDAQWMANHTVKNMKDTLDLASKMIFQTSDANYVGRNVLSAIETGQILTHSANQPLTRLANDNPSIQALQNFGTMWQNLAQEITSTPEALRGVTPPSGTALGTVQITTSQGLSLFELMTENKGLAIENMMRSYVIPHLKKRLKNRDEVVAILDDAGIQEIDAMYVPKAAVRNFNNHVKEDLLKGTIPTPYDPLAEEDSVRADLAELGNKRFFKPDELGEKQWDEIFSDFQWDSIRVEVTNEQSEKGVVLQTMTTVLQTIASNPLILQDPTARMILSGILRETGVISPLQLASAKPPQTPMVAPQGGGGATEAELPVRAIQQ